MEHNNSLLKLPLTHTAKQAQYMEMQQDDTFLVSLSPYLSILDIQMFGHIDVNCPKKNCPQVQQILPEIPCISEKITAGDTMGLHVNIMLPPPYKLAIMNFSVIL
jgi:hypothetical protein